MSASVVGIIVFVIVAVLAWRLFCWLLGDALANRRIKSEEHPPWHDDGWDAADQTMREWMQQQERPRR